MSETVTLRLVRPYASEDALIAAEAWTIDKKGMILLGQERLPSGTLVRFELVLEGGQRVLVAEGKAVGYAKPDGERPGGAKVRFRRFNAAGKAFIDRALAVRAEQEAAKAEQEAAAPDPAAPAAAADPEATSPDPAEASDPAAAEEARAEHPAFPTNRDDVFERSGIRQRAVGPIAPPENREELLERLRERARLAKAREADAADEDQSA